MRISPVGNGSQISLFFPPPHLMKELTKQSKTKNQKGTEVECTIGFSILLVETIYIIKSYVMATVVESKSLQNAKEYIACCTRFSKWPCLED